MNVEKKQVELGSELLPNHLRLKAPLTEQHQNWVAEELTNYVTAIRYLAFFFEMRSKLGDMTEQEVWDEVKKNVSMAARGGFDILGVQ